MWWYGYGWWWWWIAFVLIFFLLPLGYGWGYRGWGPWYHRGHRHHPVSGAPPPDEQAESDWGWVAIFLWFMLFIAIIWLIAAWGWGVW